MGLKQKRLEWLSLGGVVLSGVSHNKLDELEELWKLVWGFEYQTSITAKIAGLSILLLPRAWRWLRKWYESLTNKYPWLDRRRE